MKIVADENMPLVRELFAAYGDVVLTSGRDLATSQLRDADVLLVRSVTNVNQVLLANTPVRFVGTGTIGVDHIDQDYLASNGIQFTSAAGCNAQAVVQYVFSAIANQMPNWRDKNIAIVGCGNVGGAIYRRLRALGVQCKAVDPFLSASSGFELISLEQAFQQADIISLHTPYTRDGAHPTHHLVSEVQLKQLKPGSLLINAGRGGVIDNHALNKLLSQGLPIKVVLDVWEGEPSPNLDLLQKVNISTPHIAGYSIEGREKGTWMVYEQFIRWLGQSPAGDYPGETGVETIFANSLNELLLKTYSIAEDSLRTRNALLAAEDVSARFDQLRKQYPQRRDYGYYRVISDNPSVLKDADQLGYSL